MGRMWKIPKASRFLSIRVTLLSEGAAFLRDLRNQAFHKWHLDPSSKESHNFLKRNNMLEVITVFLNIPRNCLK